MQTNGNQMFEFKRVQAMQSFSMANGEPTGLNQYYKEEHTAGVVQKKGTEKRASLVAAGY